MRIKTFEELTTIDERVAALPRPDLVTGTITHWPSPLVPIQAMIAQCDLAPAVPDHVRTLFETCRTLHSYGCFAYEFFTVAEQRTYAVFEAALGARFIAHYPDGIPLANEMGEIEYVQATFFSEVTAALHRNGSHSHLRAKKGWILEKHPRFDGSLRSLLRWARDTGLLSGRRNRITESTLHWFRNCAAHPHTPYLVMPGHSALAIRDVAEIINHLWGQPTPGGRLYGPPMPMMLVCLHRASDDNQRAGSSLPHLRQLVVPSLALLRALDASDRSSRGLWALLEVANPDEADDWSPEYEGTAYPTTLVATASTWDETVAAWEAYEAAGRTPQPREWRNRLFLARYGQTHAVEWPRSPSQFRALAPQHRDLPGTNWWIVRADDPGDMLWDRPDKRTVPTYLPGAKLEEVFPVQIEFGPGSWEKAAEHLTSLGH